MVFGVKGEVGGCALFWSRKAHRCESSTRALVRVLQGRNGPLSSICIKKRGKVREMSGYKIYPESI